MDRLPRSAMLFTSLSVVFALICAAGLSAQTRLNDKDFLQHVKNLQDDAKKFRSSFNRALAKSTIRTTTRRRARRRWRRISRGRQIPRTKRSSKAPRPNRTCRIASTTARQIDKS
jgi:hypothetical protein